MDHVPRPPRDVRCVRTASCPGLTARPKWPSARRASKTPRTPPTAASPTALPARLPRPASSPSAARAATSRRLRRPREAPHPRARKSTTAARAWIAAPPEAAQLRGRPREAPHPRAQHLDDLSSCSPPRTKPLSLPRHDAEDHTRHASSAEQVGAQIPHRRGYGLPQAPLSSRASQRFEGRPHLDVSSSPREPSKTSAAAWLWSRG